MRGTILAGALQTYRGASGSGKTRISYRVANRFNVGITEVDDFRVHSPKLIFNWWIFPTRIF